MRNQERESELILVPHDSYLNLFHVRAHAAVICVCCFPDARGLLPHERNMFFHQKFEA